MKWFLLITGGLWILLSIVGAAQMAFSERRRRAQQRLGARPLVTLAATGIAGVGGLAGGLRSPPSLALAVIGLAPMLVLSVVHRRSLRGREDIPPPLARMLEVPLNPFTQLRHPIRTWRAQWSAFGHPIRSRREMRDWERGQPKE